MRSRLFIALALALAGSLAGCFPEKLTVPAVHPVHGTWEWVSSAPRQGGAAVTPASHGAAIRYLFRPDSTVQVLRNGTATEQARYRFVVRADPADPAVERSRIVFEPATRVVGEPRAERAVELTTDRRTLVLTDMDPAGYAHTFNRVQ